MVDDMLKIAAHNTSVTGVRLTLEDGEKIKSINNHFQEILKAVIVVPLEINDAMLITPVAQKYKKPGKPDSRRDYEEQCERFKAGKQLCWDDSTYNKSQKGDLFAFSQQGNCVEFHRIESVHKPIHRLPTWSDNVGQGERNVIMLSPMICKITWVRWRELGGHKRVQGTKSVITNRRRIIDYIKENAN